MASTNKKKNVVLPNVAFYCGKFYMSNFLGREKIFDKLYRS